MDKSRINKTVEILAVIGTYISFCFSGWYYARGSAALMQSSYPIFANEIFAFFIGGVFAFAIFELIVRMFLHPARNTLRLNTKPVVMHLRIFFMAANLACFGVSFVYFAYRLLYVWGRILFNFIITLLFFIGFLIYETKKMPDKTKTGPFIMQTGLVFILVYGVAVTVINLLLSVI